MLWRLLKSPVSFFDQTPVGRIVNRFTSDFQTIDREIADNFVGVARSVLDLVSSFAVILFVLPVFIVWMLPMLFLYYRLQKQYRKTAREIKRINSNSRSPIFQHFNETISGLITMRAFGETPRFQAKCGTNIDNFSRTMMCQMTIGRWLSVRLQSLGAATLFFSALASLDEGLLPISVPHSHLY
jgi:ABC-type multidrug transport system fused ATPase/permease subunit